jgi:hypothetical protein
MRSVPGLIRHVEEARAVRSGEFRIAEVSLGGEFRWDNVALSQESPRRARG